jgi:hypothetical protein
MSQLGIRMLVLLVDIAANAFALGALQAFSIEPNYAWFIIILNAVLILGIYAADLFIVTAREYMERFNIGKRVMDGKLHEE